MTRSIAFAPIARAAGRMGAASRALVAMTYAKSMSTRSQHVVMTTARSPGPGRS